jgi:hypothetical protein
LGAPDGSAGSSQRGASTVVSSRELGAGLHWRVRHWCRRHHGARSRALRARAVWICAGRGGGATVGVLGRVGAARRIISAWWGCLLSGASRWAVHGSRCSRVLAVRDPPSLLCGESTPTRPALLPLARWPLGRSNCTAASMHCSNASGGLPSQEQCWRKRTHRSQVRIHAVAACLSKFCCDESSSPWPVLLPLVQGPLDAATARLRPCVAPFLQMVQREGTHRSADTRRGGLLEQWRKEVWWFVRARCLLALRAVYRSEWGQGGGSSGGDGWDGAARGVRRFWGALSTAGGGIWSQIA